MSGKYQAYPEYKDSGVEWLGHIPTDWELWKLTHAYEEIGSGTTPPSGSDEWYGGDVPWVTTGELRETEIVSTTKSVTEETLRRFPTLRKYPKGSIAIAMYGATIGRLGIFGIEATTNQACCVLTKSAVIDNKYLYYWLQAFKPDIVNLASGGGQPNINQEVVASLKISSPEVSGQKKIANFLDHETAKIDTLIEKQQQLIALLKEKRQAVISHAVTKGLNANAPMRDSGVEWLGEVPEHWDVMQLRRITHLQQGLQIPQENRFAEGGEDRAEYITIKSINAGDTAEHKEYIHSPSERVVCTEDDILLARTGATGQVVTNVSGAFHNNFFKVNYEKNKVSRDYLVYFLRVAEVKSHLLMLAGTTTIPDLNHGAFLGTLVSLPNFEEQKSICAYLDETLERYGYIIQQAQDSVKLMQERRTALISAAVTGKIDVRNWSTPEENKNKEVA
jgi:type I restriction enzyme S subunit